MQDLKGGGGVGVNKVHYGLCENGKYGVGKKIGEHCTYYAKTS